MSDLEKDFPFLTGPVADTAPASLVAAIEANTAAFLLDLGRAGGGEERDDPRIHWVIGGSPLAYHNCVVRADLGPEEADAAIAASLAAMQAHGVRGSWHVGPSMRPADPGERLLAHGFAHAGDEPGMAVALSQLREDVPAPEGLAIERVRGEDGLALWARTLAATGFGEGDVEADWVTAMYARIGLGDDVPWRHYVGRLDGRPVATATLYLGAGVAGVYFISTMPDARRRGIGATLTLAGLREARALGMRVGVLGASALGHPLYRRLGFEEYCRIALYEWTPPEGEWPA